MSETLKLGVIGLGFGSAVHLPVFLSLPEIESVGVADTGSGNGEEAAQKAGVDFIYGGWRELLKVKGLQAVSVVTPPGSQADIVCEALRAGMHVLCEKPFGKNLDEAHQMFAKADVSQLVHAIDFQFRMEPGFLALKDQISQGVIGDIERIDVTWLTGGRSDASIPWSWQNSAELGGGAINAFGSHVIDYLEWLSNDQIATVYAEPKVSIRQRTDFFGKKREVTAEDGCDLLFTFASGSMSSVRVSNVHRFGFGHRVEIYGSKGCLTFSHRRPFAPEGQACWIERDGLEAQKLSLKFSHNHEGVDSRSWAFCQLARLFVQAAHGDRNCNLPTFAHGLRVRQVIDAIGMSIQKRSCCSVTVA